MKALIFALALVVFALPVKEAKAWNALSDIYDIVYPDIIPEIIPYAIWDGIVYAAGLGTDIAVGTAENIYESSVHIAKGEADLAVKQFGDSIEVYGRATLENISATFGKKLDDKFE